MSSDKPSIIVRYGDSSDLEFCQKDPLDLSDPQMRDGQLFDWRPAFLESVPRRLDAKAIIVAERDTGFGGELVGVMHTNCLWYYIPFIEFIVVEESMRNQGVGKAMLDFFVKESRDKGFRFIMSSCVVDSPESQAWHRRMGFYENGVANGISPEGVAPPGVGDLLFRKNLK